jgi:hypothetical protein
LNLGTAEQQAGDLGSALKTFRRGLKVRPRGGPRKHRAYAALQPGQPVRRLTRPI